MRIDAIARRLLAAIALSLLIALSASINLGAPTSQSQTLGKGSARVSRSEFEIIEGIFHDGLGTFAEIALANELIAAAGVKQPEFDPARSLAKMSDALSRLPENDPRRASLAREMNNVKAGVKDGARQLLAAIKPGRLTRVRHTPREYADAHAADLVLDMDDGRTLPVSVKTDKSNKVAVAEGQTPDIGEKWAKRYFRMTDAELNEVIGGLGFSSIREMKSDYLNVARLVVEVMIRKLALTDRNASDLSKSRVGDIDALKYLFHQLRFFKSGKDRSRVVIFDRATGSVKWESLLDEIDVDALTADRVTLLPSRPKLGHTVASEFGIKVDGRTVVTFQVKHKRGRNRQTARRLEFSDITTRLML